MTTAILRIHCDLHQQVVDLASTVEDISLGALQALGSTDQDAAYRVILSASAATARCIELEDQAVTMLTQRPLLCQDPGAPKLILELISDVRSICNHATAIADIVFLDAPALNPTVAPVIQPIIQKVRWLVRCSAGLLARPDTLEAERIEEEHEALASLYQAAQKDLFAAEAMEVEQRKIAATLLWAIYHVERIGDRAVRLARNAVTVTTEAVNASA
ncbi:MAG: phosphate transport system regulatory protein PhoU [Herpetosiphonaceae bacterium]|nr:MAG: phosphate transport system regulatory protein PhoU [Herpetosiphonaceae bacterium]